MISIIIISTFLGKVNINYNKNFYCTIPLNNKIEFLNEVNKSINDIINKYKYKNYLEIQYDVEKEVD